LDGILIAAGPAIQQQTDPLPTAPQIPDLTPTILHLMNCPIPDTMDGKVLEPLITAAYLSNNPIQYQEDTITQRQDENEDWDEAAEAEIMERLKNLGYLG
jgi:hypothetical protein